MVMAKMMRVIGYKHILIWYNIVPFLLAGRIRTIVAKSIHSFAGLLRGNESGSRSISRSTSDIGDFRSKTFSDISGKSKNLPIKDSVWDILEPFEQTAFGTLWKIPTSTSFEFQSSQFDSSVDSGGTNDLVKVSSPDTFETTEAHQSVPVLARPIVEKWFVLN